MSKKRVVLAHLKFPAMASSEHTQIKEGKVASNLPEFIIASLVFCQFLRRNFLRTNHPSCLDTSQGVDSSEHKRQQIDIFFAFVRATLVTPLRTDHSHCSCTGSLPVVCTSELPFCFFHKQSTRGPQGTQAAPASNEKRLRIKSYNEVYH